MSKSIAERIEELEGPCREMDCLIENALGLAVFDRDPRVIYGDAEYNRREPQPYTASLDAAMTLVPEGWRVSDLYEFENGNATAAVRASNPARMERSKECATPALALCAAALRAQEAHNG